MQDDAGRAVVAASRACSDDVVLDLSPQSRLLKVDCGGGISSVVGQPRPAENEFRNPSDPVTLSTVEHKKMDGSVLSASLGVPLSMVDPSGRSDGGHCVCCRNFVLLQGDAGWTSVATSHAGSSDVALDLSSHSWLSKVDCDGSMSRSFERPRPVEVEREMHYDPLLKVDHVASSSGILDLSLNGRLLKVDYKGGISVGFGDSCQPREAGWSESGSSGTGFLSFQGPLSMTDHEKRSDRSSYNDFVSLQVDERRQSCFAFRAGDSDGVIDLSCHGPLS